jgi:hypothetical protein
MRTVSSCFAFAICFYCAQALWNINKYLLIQRIFCPENSAPARFNHMFVSLLCDCLLDRWRFAGRLLAVCLAACVPDRWPFAKPFAMFTAICFYSAQARWTRNEVSLIGQIFFTENSAPARFNH